MLFDHRFWNSFSWTPHGLSMAYLWRIYGGSQGELVFWVFLPLFFGIWYTWRWLCPRVIHLFFCLFGRERNGLKRAVCFWPKNGVNSGLDRVVFIDGGKTPTQGEKYLKRWGKTLREVWGIIFNLHFLKIEVFRSV